MIHSAVIEDGRISSTPGSMSPWKQTQRLMSHYADVDWKPTIRNFVTCVLIGKFGAHGPKEATTINLCALLIVVWQTRPVRFAMKVMLSLAAAFRGGYFVDLFSTLLPTSHQVLLDALEEKEVEVKFSGS